MREEAHHCPRVTVVHREPVAHVVEREPERAELLHDLAAVVADEVPAPLDERRAAEVAIVDSFGGEPPHHHVLERDAGVVVPRLPERVEVAHAVEADEHVLARAVEGVAHVQPVGDVRRRHADDVGRARIVGVRVVEALFLPGLLPTLLDALRLVERVHRADVVRQRL